MIDGRQIYLGCHGTPESRKEYERIIAAWLGNSRQLPQEVLNENACCDELFLAYLDHA